MQKWLFVKLLEINLMIIFELDKSQSDILLLYMKQLKLSRDLLVVMIFILLLTTMNLDIQAFYF